MLLIRGYILTQGGELFHKMKKILTTKGWFLPKCGWWETSVCREVHNPKQYQEDALP